MGDDDERVPPGLWCWLGHDSRKENEEAGFYHFEETKPSMMEALSSRRPLSTDGPIEASRRKPSLSGNNALPIIDDMEYPSLATQPISTLSQ